jgi:mannose-6-phosphate isomerase-like protein (cupin superfamily)
MTPSGPAVSRLHPMNAMSSTATSTHIEIGDDVAHIRVASDETDGALFALDVRIPPGGGPPMLHRHAPAELYRVESGGLAFYLADEDGTVRRRVAAPGSVVLIESGREHTVRNEFSVDATAYVVFAPGAEMERFVRGAGALAAAGRMSKEAMLDFAAGNGVELTRPIPETAELAR